MKYKSRFIVLLMIACVLCISASMGLMAGGTKEAMDEEPSLTIMLHPVLYSATGGDGGLIDQFEQETGIPVDVMTGPLDQILEKTLLDFVAGTSAIDVFVYNDTALHNGLSEHLLPLDDYLNEADSKHSFDSADILQSTMDFGRFGGKLYGIPFRYGVYMLYYRQDLFEKYKVKVPETWAELNKAAEKITESLRDEGITDVYGLVHPGQAGHIIYEVFKTWLAGNGGLLADENGKVLIDSPESIAALTTLVAPYQNGWASPETPSMALDSAIAAFQNGKAAMALTYSPYWGLFNNPESSSVAGKIGWALTPHAEGVEPGRSSFSGWQLLINKNTEFPKAAWQLVEFLSTAEATKNMALNFANGPVRASVYEDPEYLEMFGVARGWLQGLKASEPLMPGGHEKISEMMDIIGREVSNALLGNKTPKAALQEAQVKVQAIY